MKHKSNWLGYKLLKIGFGLLDSNAILALYDFKVSEMRYPINDWPQPENNHEPVRTRKV